jgi:hypothetical protein
MHYFVSGKDSMATIGKKVATIEDALKCGRNMIESEMTSVTIEDHLGNMIDGDDLLACIKGEKVLSDDLRAHYLS